MWLSGRLHFEDIKQFTPLETSWPCWSRKAGVSSCRVQTRISPLGSWGTHQYTRGINMYVVMNICIPAWISYSNMYANIVTTHWSRRHEDKCGPCVQLSLSRNYILCTTMYYTLCLLYMCTSICSAMPFLTSSHTCQLTLRPSHWPCFLSFIILDDIDLIF